METPNQSPESSAVAAFQARQRATALARRKRLKWIFGIVGIAAAIGILCMLLLKPPAPNGDVEVEGRSEENSLGMKFVPVPIVGGPTEGNQILFSVWETRVKDFQKFVEASGYKPSGTAYTKTAGKWVKSGASWSDPHFKQSSEHPVVCVSWEDALFFCEWLTREERSKGNIGPSDLYRLPSDREWSCAAGIGTNESMDSPPRSLSSKVPEIYPWGNNWPPKPGDANLAGFEDEHPNSSPVGSYRPNASGLYDLAGNAWEWCSDLYGENMTRTMRGSSWAVSSQSLALSSSRGRGPQASGYDTVGFRCVLERNAEAASRLDDEWEDGKKLRILTAVYGASGKEADVTEKVKQLIEVERGSFSVSPNDLGADPNPGWNKSLYVVYMKGGVRRENWHTENKRVLADEYHAPQDVAETGVWIGGTRWKDVNGDELQFLSDGTVTGTDIAAGAKWRVEARKAVKVTQPNDSSPDGVIYDIWSDFARLQARDGRLTYQLVN